MLGRFRPGARPDAAVRHRVFPILGIQTPCNSRTVARNPLFERLPQSLWYQDLAKRPPGSPRKPPKNLCACDRATPPMTHCSRAPRASQTHFLTLTTVRVCGHRPPAPLPCGFAGGSYPLKSASPGRLTDDFGGYHRRRGNPLYVPVYGQGAFCPTLNKGFASGTVLLGLRNRRMTPCVTRIWVRGLLGDSLAWGLLGPRARFDRSVWYAIS